MSAWNDKVHPRRTSRRQLSHGEARKGLKKPTSSLSSTPASPGQRHARRIDPYLRVPHGRYLRVVRIFQRSHFQRSHNSRMLQSAHPKPRVLRVQSSSCLTTRFHRVPHGRITSGPRHRFYSASTAAKEAWSLVPSESMDLRAAESQAKVMVSPLHRVPRFASTRSRCGSHSKPRPKGCHSIIASLR